MNLLLTDTVFSVNDLNQIVKDLLADAIGEIWLTGEISNFSKPTSGHWYFTLKDDKAQVRCAMFRQHNYRAGFLPANGQKVLVHASVTLYEVRGEYQLVIDSVQLAGIGLLQKQFEVLKARLEMEGLFRIEHKQSLPEFIRQIGVVTSPTGAALYDICHVLQRRDPGLHIIIYPTIVQGKEAAAHIVQMIQLANVHNECDVLIVGRGGGSLEDLWPFNEEIVARAIFSSNIPVISAVGHEIDFTIADFVADVRAATPSAAAELVSKNRPEQKEKLKGTEQRFFMAMDYLILRQRQHFSALEHRLAAQHPQLQLNHYRHRFEHYQARLVELLRIFQRKMEQQYRGAIHQLFCFSPDKNIIHNKLKVTQWQQKLCFVFRALWQKRDHEFTVKVQKLEQLSPLKILTRGYSITTNDKGKMIISAGKVKTGEMLFTQFAKGQVQSEVVKIIKNKRR